MSDLRNNGRKKVQVVLGAPSTFGSLWQLQRDLEMALLRAKQESLQDLQYNIYYERGYYDDVDLSFQFTGWRYETDEEMQMRKEKEEKARDLDKCKRRLEYEKLKKEFEGGK